MTSVIFVNICKLALIQCGKRLYRVSVSGAWIIGSRFAGWLHFSGKIVIFSDLPGTERQYIVSKRAQICSYRN